MSERVGITKVGGGVLAASLIALALWVSVTPISFMSAPAQALYAHAEQGAVAQTAARLEAATPLGGQSVAENGKAYTMPVKMLKRTSDDASMAAPVMHPTAYAKYENGSYTVKVYFVNAPIMGSTIFSGSLGEATYDKAGDGVMVPVDNDVYDKKTQVKVVTMTVAALDVPLAFHLEMFMDNVRLVFDASQMVEANAEPVFPEVESSVTKYPAGARAVVGGSGNDSANALAQCPNGSVVIAGSTSSTDQSFSSRNTADEQAYVSICSPEGEVLSTSHITGADSVGIFGLSAAADSSFFACGYFQTKEAAATGDFANLTKEGCEATRNAFVAKYNANNKLQWVKALCNTQACQYDGVAATPDGGCIAVAEYLKGTEASDYADEVQGIVNTIVVKYDAAGAEEWHTVLTGSSVIDTDGAVAVTSRGTYLVAGSFAYASANGMLSQLDRFGGTFDIYVLELDARGTVVATYSYGGSGTNESVGDILATADGGFMLAGYTESTDGTFTVAPAKAGSSNGFVLKCGSDGSVAWADAHKATQDTEAHKTIGLNGEYVVVGSGEGKDADFAELAKGQNDVYVARYDAEGHRTSLLVFGGSKNEYASGLAAAGDGQFVFLVQSESSDVDMEGLARGGFDAVLVWSNEEAGEDAQRAIDAVNATAVEGLIEALPEAWDIVEADQAAISAARAAFDSLNAEATALVSEEYVAKLQLAEKAMELSSSGRLAVKRLVETLEALPANPGVADAAAVKEARSSYDALSDDQKGLLSAGTLAAIESAEKSVRAAQEIAEKAAREAAAKAKAEKAAHTVASVKTVSASAAYTGKAVKPRLTVVAKDGSPVAAAHYTVTWSNNVNAGTASVTVTGRNSYSGTAKATFAIAPASIAKAKVVLKKASAAYTGKAQRGAVKSVTLNGVALKAADYSVKATAGKKAGSYAVVVTGKGNYTGSSKVAFKVTKAKAKVKAAASKALKERNLKKKAVSFKAFKLTTDGAVAYKVIKKDAARALSFKAGKVTVKKGAKAGVYKIKVKVSAKAGKNYKALKAKTYTIKVTVKK